MGEANFYYFTCLKNITNHLVQSSREKTLSKMVVKIHVVYCGAWGYKPKFDRLKATLMDDFDGEIEMTGEGTPGATGYFEVDVAGTLVHSKKNGDGYVDNEAKLNKIKQAIEAALK